MGKQLNNFLLIRNNRIHFVNMKNCIIRFSKTQYLFNWTVMIILFISNLSVQAQPTPKFIMSSIGTLDGSLNTSMAIQFNSISTCLNVQNGIAVLRGERGNGEFAINCEVLIKINSLGVKLYPNPVGANTKVKFLNTPPLNEIFSLTIWTADGILINTRKETGYNLFQGTIIDLSKIISGTYVLRIEGANYIDNIKFIKGN